MHNKPLYGAAPADMAAPLPEPGDLQSCTDILDRMTAVFDYLKQPQVINAWTNPRNRVYSRLYYDRFLLGEIGDTGAYASYWKTFINEWLDRREEQVSEWWNSVSAGCINWAYDYSGCLGSQFEVAFEVDGRWDYGLLTFPREYWF